MFPMSVVGRSKFTPKATYVIILINVLVFIWELSLRAQGEEIFNKALKDFGLEVCMIGTQSFGTTILDTFRGLFLHGSVAHIVANMWFLFIFGGMVEKFLGSVKYFGLYVVFGYFATIAHVIFGSTMCTDTNTGVLYGASGAIAGVMGAFLFLYPGAKVKTLVGLIKPFVWSIKVPAFLYLGYWLIIDLLQEIGWIGGGEPNVAHWAHIGGFLAGFAILFVIGFFKPVPKPDPLAHLVD